MAKIFDELSPRCFRDGPCINTNLQFRQSKADWYIVYMSTRKVKSREEIKTWNKDVREYQIHSGNIYEAVRKV